MLLPSIIFQDLVFGADLGSGSFSTVRTRARTRHTRCTHTAASRCAHAHARAPEATARHAPPCQVRYCKHVQRGVPAAAWPEYAAKVILVRVRVKVS